MKKATVSPEGNGEGQTTVSKVDPSFKSKRYRDKLRTEVKALENLLPVDRPALHRKLDSQTVYRLIIAYLRMKCLFKDQELSAKKEKAQETTGDRDGSEKVGVASEYLSGTGIFQILDGFLLVASVDGTILYVSENVLQHLGFNQVDLMHRCMYGIVHPHDHQDLRNALEGTESRQDDTKQVPGTSRTDWPKKDESRPVSVLCRMKCFRGNTARYMKIQCSGKIQHVRDLPTSTRTSGNVVLLYCLPFMLTGNDVSHDVKRDVFWTKHDMDLKFRDIDKTAKDLTGYDCEELRGRSFYQLVHPNDLFTCVAVHKALTESTEVQTMYFRLQNKEAGWLWVHCRGKVICKNAKKFSIVLSHCPIREADSTFIRQESALRQRYALQDLTYLRQCNLYTRNHDDRNHDDIHPCLSQSHDASALSDPDNDEVSVTLHSALLPCPSSWHASSDRHSPVLPSSHVAHKITQREKQIQFAEFKRRQQELQQQQSRPVHMGTWQHYGGLTTDSGYSFNQQLFNPDKNIDPTSFQMCNYGPYPAPFCQNSGGQSFVFNQLNSSKDSCMASNGVLVPFGPVSQWSAFYQNHLQQGYGLSGTFDGYFRCQPYNLPPSPPPSPDNDVRDQPPSRYPEIATRQQHLTHHPGMVSRDLSLIHYPNTANRPGTLEQYQELSHDGRYSNQQRHTSSTGTDDRPGGNTCFKIKEEREEVLVSSNKRVRLDENCERQQSFATRHPHPALFQTHANIPLLTHHPSSETSRTLQGRFAHGTNGQDLMQYSNDTIGQNSLQTLPSNHCMVKAVPSVRSSPEDIKYRSVNDKSCAILNGFRSSAKTSYCVQYDIEAADHMRIVESERVFPETKKDLDIPVIGSFLEYLNENR